MKDYEIIKYLGNIVKDCDTDKEHFCIGSFFAYGNARVDYNCYFDHDESKSLSFFLDDVYEQYGRRQYASVNEFVRAFVAKNSFFTIGSLNDGSLYVESDLRNNRTEKTRCAPLENMGVITHCLNELLGRNEENIFLDKDINEFIDGFIAREEKKFALLEKVGYIAGGVLAGLGIIGLVGKNDVGALGIILGIGLAIAGLVFRIKGKNVKKKYR